MQQSLSVFLLGMCTLCVLLITKMLDTALVVQWWREVTLPPTPASSQDITDTASTPLLGPSRTTSPLASPQPRISEDDNPFKIPRSLPTARDMRGRSQAGSPSSTPAIPRRPVEMEGATWLHTK